jgi:hypothetical protein
VSRVELLYWDGCPSHPQALADLRAALEALGRGDLAVSVREVADDGAAAAERFVGSPTIRVDGADLFPPPDDEPPSLSCRIYRLRDGRVSPVPDAQLLRAALARALA